MRPSWISHRGYKAAAVENTVEAFRAAESLGFRALETDLRLSRDGHIVLHHDPDLRRLAGRPDQIASLTRRELETVRLTGGARLLFLDEFLETFAGCSWVFDIKAETGFETVRALDQWARAKGIQDLLVGQSRFLLWSAKQEALLQSLFPRASFYAQERECWRAGLSVIAFAPWLAGIKAGRVYSLVPRFGRIEVFRSEIVRAFHDRGAKVLAFLPELEADQLRAAQCGFDEILTNGRIIEGGGHP